MMKRILIPTDFSECAENAALVAGKLAKEMEIELHFLHSVQSPVDWSRIPNTKEKNYPEVIAAINRAKSNFIKIRSKVPFKTLEIKEHIGFNATHKDIVGYAKQYNIDLIIMGSHGASGINAMFIGSNTQKVIRLSKIPILVVKRRVSSFTPKNIVFACSFEKDMSKVFLPVKLIAAAYGSTIHLLNVNTPTFFEDTSYSMIKMEDFALKNCKKGKYTLNTYNEYSVEEGIQHFSDQVNADMIVIASHHRKGISRIVTGSITENLLNHSTIPILSITAK